MKDNYSLSTKLCLTNTDGSRNFGADLFNKFCIIAGATDGADIAEPVSRMLPMGKGGEEVGVYGA